MQAGAGGDHRSVHAHWQFVRADRTSESETRTSPARAFYQDRRPLYCATESHRTVSSGLFLGSQEAQENRACADVSSNVGATHCMLHTHLSFLRPQEQTRGHCTIAFCCTVQRSSILVVKRPEVPCCGQPSFLSFQNLPPAVRLKHPFPINNRHGRSRPFWFCRRESLSSH